MRVEQTGTIIDVYDDANKVHIKARRIRGVNIKGELDIYYQLDFNDKISQPKPHKTEFSFLNDGARKR